MVRFRSGAAVAALLAALALPGPMEAEAAASQPWHATLLSQPGEFVGQGQDVVLDERDAPLIAFMSEDGRELRVRTPNEASVDFSLVASAPEGQRLAVGHYPYARTAQPGRPALDVGFDHRGCRHVHGDFEIRELHITGGTVDRLWLLYEQHCGNNPRALSGELRIGPPGSTALVPQARAVRHPDVHPGARAAPATVWWRATAPTTVSRLYVSGPDATSFPIAADACTGRTLAAGERCTVQVGFAPVAPGPRTARLRLVTSAGTRLSVALDGYGLPGRTDWTMTSDPGDYIGQGRTWRYTVADSLFAFGRVTPSRVRALQDGPGGWYADFESPRGTTLATGSYSGARRAVVGLPTSAPGLDVTGDGRGCNVVSGRFDVTQLAVHPVSGDLERFAATFEQHCEGAASALRGTLRWRARSNVRPPGPVTALTVVPGPNSVQLRWTNPTSSDYRGTAVRYLPGGAGPRLATAGLAAYAGTGTATAVKGLATGEQYTFAVFTYDTAGNVRGPQLVTLRAG